MKDRLHCRWFFFVKIFRGKCADMNPIPKIGRAYGTFKFNVNSTSG